MESRIMEHPILGEIKKGRKVSFYFDGKIFYLRAVIYQIKGEEKYTTVCKRSGKWVEINGSDFKEIETDTFDLKDRIAVGLLYDIH